MTQDPLPGSRGPDHAAEVTRARSRGRGRGHAGTITRTRPRSRGPGHADAAEITRARSRGRGRGHADPVSRAGRRRGRGRANGSLLLHCYESATLQLQKQLQYSSNCSSKCSIAAAAAAASRSNCSINSSTAAAGAVIFHQIFAAPRSWRVSIRSPIVGCDLRSSDAISDLRIRPPSVARVCHGEEASSRLVTATRRRDVSSP